MFNPSACFHSSCLKLKFWRLSWQSWVTWLLLGLNLWIWPHSRFDLGRTFLWIGESSECVFRFTFNLAGGETAVEQWLPEWNRCFDLFISVWELPVHQNQLNKTWISVRVGRSGVKCSCVLTNETVAVSDGSNRVQCRSKEEDLNKFVVAKNTKIYTKKLFFWFFLTAHECIKTVGRKDWRKGEREQGPDCEMLYCLHGNRQIRLVGAVVWRANLTHQTSDSF